MNMGISTLGFHSYPIHVASAKEDVPVCLQVPVSSYCWRKSETGLQKQGSTEKALHERPIHRLLIVEEGWEEWLVFPVFHWKGPGFETLLCASFVASQEFDGVVEISIHSPFRISFHLVKVVCWA